MVDFAKIIKDGKAIIGTKETIEGLKQGMISKVYLSVNTPLEAKDDIKTYAQMSGAEVEELEVPNDEFGVLCKKPFAISVLGVKK